MLSPSVPSALLVPRGRPHRAGGEPRCSVVQDCAERRWLHVRRVRPVRDECGAGGDRLRFGSARRSGQHSARGVLPVARTQVGAGNGGARRIGQPHCTSTQPHNTRRHCVERSGQADGFERSVEAPPFPFSQAASCVLWCVVCRAVLCVCLAAVVRSRVSCCSACWLITSVVVAASLLRCLFSSSAPPRPPPPALSAL